MDDDLDAQTVIYSANQAVLVSESEEFDDCAYGDDQDEGENDEEGDE